MPDEVSVIPELRPAIALASLICSSHADSSSALHWVCAHSAWRRLRPDRMGTGPHPGLSCRLIVCNSMTFRLSAVGLISLSSISSSCNSAIGSAAFLFYFVYYIFVLFEMFSNMSVGLGMFGAVSFGAPSSIPGSVPHQGQGDSAGQPADR